MEYRRMGRSGLKLSALSLGSWVTFGDQIDAERAGEILHRAYDLGVNYFDNADIYAEGQAEVVMGRAIRDLPREALVLSSKVYWPTMPGPNGRGLSRKHIIESCHASLRRMNVEYFDLYFCHRFDPETPMDEIVRAMDDLVHQGKVLYWGTSEWRGSQISEAHLFAERFGCYAPAVEQPQYNLFVREKMEQELALVADSLGIGMVTWSPLRYGLLSGKYNTGMPDEPTRLTREPKWAQRIVTDEAVEKVRALSELAKELGVAVAQLAIAWALRLPQVSSVITGATRVEHLEQNLAALDVLDLLCEEILDRIDAIMGNIPA